MSIWTRPYRRVARRLFADVPRDPRAVGYLAFGLTEEGQKQARLRGVGAGRQQMINVMVGESDMDVFSVDADGTLLAATYIGATLYNRPVPRSPLLLADVFFDTPPQDGRDLIGWIRCHSIAQRDRAIETQARMAYLMQAQSGYRVVQVDSGASGPLTLAGLAQAFQERIGVIATREFSIDEVFRRAAHNIEDDSSPAVKRHIRYLKEDE